MLLPTQDKKARLTPREIQKYIDLARQSGSNVNINATGYKYGWRRAINDAIDDQIAKLEKLGYHKGLPSTIEEALNIGDGTYRP